MTGKRIVFTAPEKAELQNVEIRQPNFNEVVTENIYTCISAGTEKANFINLPNTMNKFPQYPGYSGVGKIIQIGESIKSYSIGDLVFINYGGHCSHCVTPRIMKLPPEIDLKQAVFAKIASFPMLALRRSGLEIGESCAVVGLGLLGLFAVRIAKLMGAYPIIAVGNREIRKQLALDYGADYVFSPDDPDLTAKIFDLTQKHTLVKGASVVIETSGTTSAVLSCLEYTAKHGRVLLNGCNRITDKPIDLYKYIHFKGVSLIGAHDGTYHGETAKNEFSAIRNYQTFFNMILTGQINVSKLISEINEPEKAPDVYNRLANDRNFPLGVLFKWKEEISNAI